ncbi:MAG: bifunctional homocysteine S-methyltransferase/methylenetetrahydrofolate reductase [Anaerotignaceae bacterium]
MEIRKYIEEHVLIFDGGLGTYFLAVAPNPMEKCELGNLHQESTILEIHQQYINAGCKAISTNTFGANRPNLNNDSQLTKTVIEKGYNLAKKAADEDIFVFADIGPIEVTGNTNIYQEYKFIVDTFINAGASNFLFETLSNPEGLEEISAYIKEKVPNAYIITSFAVQPDGYTRDGNFGETIFQNLSAIKEIDALGVNCISGPNQMEKYIASLNLEGITLCVMPNAGYPTVINNRTIFESTPRYFALKMANIVQDGAKIIGGCCGTTPEHIKATVAEVGKLTKDSHILPKAKVEIEKVHRQNSFYEKLESGKKVIAVELDPPANADCSKFMANAYKVKEFGADLITIADCPIGMARMDSSMMAAKVKREVEIDVLPHITCRDRNLNATKALLLGLNVENVNNVLVITGDPIPSAQRDEVKSVFNFNSRMLAKFITNLNETVLPSPFTVHAALNVNARNFNVQLALAKEKVKNGVKVFLTQPVITEKAFNNLKQAHEELDAKILGGIIPIMSYRNACFMDSEISGINVSEEIISLYENKTKEECAQMAVSISLDLAKKMESYVDGFYIITPFNRADIVCQIIEGL